MSNHQNTIDTPTAIQSARDWLIAHCKKHKIQKSAVFTTTNGNAVSCVTHFGANSFGGARLAKFESLVSNIRNGFEKSPKWICNPSSNHQVSIFNSNDGRFHCRIVKKYNGSGGYKVATIVVGITIIDLHPTNTTE